MLQSFEVYKCVCLTPPLPSPAPSSSALSPAGPFHLLSISRQPAGPNQSLSYAYTHGAHYVSAANTYRVVLEHRHQRALPCRPIPDNDNLLVVHLPHLAELG